MPKYTDENLTAYTGTGLTAKDLMRLSETMRNISKKFTPSNPAIGSQWEDDLKLVADYLENQADREFEKADAPKGIINRIIGML